MLKRKHHYVNRFYLQPWTRDGKIACWLRGKIVQPSLDGVANQRDFYEVPDLQPEDVMVIRKAVIDKASPGLKPIFEDLLEKYTSVGLAHGLLVGNENVPDRIQDAARADKANLDENYHASIEGDLHLPLREMREGRADFFRDSEIVGPFFRAISLQYLRTKNMRVAMNHRVGMPVEGADMDRIWIPMIHMLAMTVGESFFRERSKLRLLLLESPPEVTFITGDQPVVNIVEDRDEMDIPKDLELYYPVSPSRAMVMVHERSPLISETARLTVSQVQAYNRRIVENYHEQFYGKSVESLEDWTSLALLAGDWS
jgi:hypothetical protein